MDTPTTKMVDGVPVPLTQAEIDAITAEWAANAAAATVAAQSATAKAAITSRQIKFDARVGTPPLIVAIGLSIVTGHWLATWTGGHDGSVLSPSLARGTSLTLTGGKSYPLTLSLDINGNLILRGSLLRDYTVSLNLFGR